MLAFQRASEDHRVYFTMRTQNRVMKVVLDLRDFAFTHLLSGKLTPVDF